MYLSPRARGWAVAALSLTLVAGLGVAPAAARQDPGTPMPSDSGPLAPSPFTDSRFCPLTRIGTQFVRCDDLTGAGVAAPSWVPES